MRTRTSCRPPVGRLLWTAVTALAVSSFVVAGCGDDSNPGGGTQGGGGSEAGGGGSDPTGGSPTGGSGGQGGSGGAPANDTCDAPGAISIGPGEEVAVQGTLEGAIDDYKLSCADSVKSGDSAIEVVYELTVTAACNATLDLSGGGDFDAVISVRTACENDPTEQCFNANGTVAESGAVSFPPGVYYVMVSDASNSGGTFALNIQCGSPTCGDFILDADTDEECDFGPGIDDGCSDICILDPVDPDVTDCTAVTNGPAVDIDLNDTLFVSGSTINGAKIHIGSCQETPTPPDEQSKENIIKVHPTAAGNLTLTLGEDTTGNPYCGLVDPDIEGFPYPAGCYDRSIYVRTVCATAATQVGCVETDLNVGANWYDVETLTIPVLANTDYYVFVDGWLDYGPGDQSDVGIYDLKLELDPIL